MNVKPHILARTAFFVVLFGLGAVQSHAIGDFLAPSFSGTTEYEGWSDLTVNRLTGYPTNSTSTNPWPQPVAPNDPGSAGNAEFDKVTGGGYPAGASIYNSFSEGSYEIANDSPITGLSNVFFQVELGGGADFTGGVLGEGGFFTVEPVLNYNGGTQALDPTTSFDYFSTRVFNLPFPIEGIEDGGFTSIFALQWDMSSITDPITSYEIVWTTESFVTTYALQLDSSDTFVAVDPPSEMLLGDYDDDGAVGQGDLDLVLQFWGDAVLDGESPDPTWINADTVTASLIGQDELAIVLQNWGNTSSLVSGLGAIADATNLSESEIRALIPEPTTAALFMGLGWLALRRKRSA